MKRRSCAIAAAIGALAACSTEQRVPTNPLAGGRLDVSVPSTLVRGDSVLLQPRIVLANGQTRAVDGATYRVADSTILQLTSRGLARAIRPGITVIDVAGEGLRTSIDVFVVPALASLSIRVEPRVLAIGDSAPVTIIGTDSSGAEVPAFARLTVEPASAAEFRGGWLVARTPAIASLVARAGPRSARDTIVAQSLSQFDLQLVGAPGAPPLPARILAVMARVQTRLKQVVRAAPLGGRVQLNRDACDNPDPVDENISGLRIVVRIAQLGGAIGVGAPCVLREGSGLPLFGSIVIDTSMFRSAPEPVIDQLFLHEALHVLGLGVLWSRPAFGGYVVGAPEDAEPVFVGPNALRGWQRVLGTAALTVRPVPVEPVTMQHWRNPLLTNELFSPRLRMTRQVLSAISVGALKDIGWEVESEAYDDLTLTDPVATAVAPKMLGVERVGQPKFVLTRSGRLERMPQPKAPLR